MFYVYDMFVQRRNEKLIINAAKSNAVVSSLFPGTLRDRVINQTDPKNLQASSHHHSSNLQQFLAQGGAMDTSSEPLADLFVETTILFADLVGFTAWSSIREPTQVFKLLESVYSAFDALAVRRGVYKIETVGDCYVAVTGLPEPRKDHAVAMARFARDIIYKMSTLTRELEAILGPGTAELSIRVGIHSGPVTAGVLRGERARFQLFGDTMNTCSRMESSGVPGKAHISKETAYLLILAGKEGWIYPREEKVFAKGKGELETYFLHLGVSSSSDQQSSKGTSDKTSLHCDDEESVHEDPRCVYEDDHLLRLVDWNVEKLVDNLRHVKARQVALSIKSQIQDISGLKDSKNPIDEVKEVIPLPAIDFDATKSQRPHQHQDIILPREAQDQIRDYVTCIASMYRPNPFHNFDHASHVVMSITKLFSRVFAPLDSGFDHDGSLANSQHNVTFGITSDPLIRFACTFAALVHDVDHPGVPNAQLIKENAKLAILYDSRSIAEQNSFDLAWNLFMDERFATFRQALCPTMEDLVRFRQWVLNCVMATDILDKDAAKQRNDRWSRAFSTAPNSSRERNEKKEMDRKATVVIEHLMQGATSRTPCSTGTCIESGMNSYSVNSTQPFRRAVVKETQVIPGMKERLHSLNCM